MKIHTFMSITICMLMGTYLQADAVTKDPVCKSIVECDKLSHTIQVQIDELEAKGLANLSDAEFIKYDKLSDNLLAAQKAKTAEQRRILAAQKAKTAEMLKEQNKQISELGALLKEK